MWETAHFLGFHCNPTFSKAAFNDFIRQVGFDSDAAKILHPYIPFECYFLLFPQVTFKLLSWYNLSFCDAGWIRVLEL